MSDWRDDSPIPWTIDAGGWLRIVWRAAALGLVAYTGLVLLLLLRLIERPLFGMARPWTPYITQFVCKSAYVIMGIETSHSGQPMRERGAIVANHGSWMDIFTLNAADRIYFVSKEDVARWPAIGWLARATGTLFITRNGREAKVQQAQLEARLRAGHRLLFFPEGTSTDAIRILPFKSTLFAAFYTHGMEHAMHIQPVTVIYHAAEGMDARHYGWWGNMDFAGHLLKMLSARKQGRAEVIFHPPVAVDDFADRKALCAYCEATIRAAHPLARRISECAPLDASSL